MIQQVYIRWLYFLGLTGIVAGMSLSKPAISVGLIVCGIAWLAEGHYYTKIKQLLYNPFFILSVLLLLLHVVGLVWSTNVGYGLKDIKTKIPLVIIPLIFSSSRVFKLANETKFVKAVFLGSLVLCSLLSFGIYFGWIKPGQYNAVDIRTMVFGVSGVRFSLFLCLGICMLAVEIYTAKTRTTQMLYFGLATWFLFFLNFIESGTGLLVLGILGLFSVLFFAFKHLRFLTAVLVLGITTVTIGLVVFGLYTFAAQELGYTVSTSVAQTHSKHGEKYTVIKEFEYYENGRMVGANVAPLELEQAWDKRSKIPYLGFDRSGYAVQTTLLRYLNSKGLNKDREGVEKLTDTDILNIENGIANSRYLTLSGWRKRLLQVVYEFEAYRAGQNPFGNSITQRLEYWKIGWNLFLSNSVFGIGTGDVEDAYEHTFSTYRYKIDEQYRLRAHNQYLTMAIALGVIGLILFLCYSTYLFWATPAGRGYLPICFAIIMLLSYLWEDTLETQSGVTFIAFFHTFYVLLRKTRTNSLAADKQGSV